MIIELIALLVLIVLFAIAFEVVKQLMPFIINSVIGLLLFWLLQAWGIVTVEVNIWTILIIAIGGIPGVILVLLLHFLGIAF